MARWKESKMARGKDSKLQSVISNLSSVICRLQSVIYNLKKSLLAGLLVVDEDGMVLLGRETIPLEFIVGRQAAAGRN